MLLRLKTRYFFRHLFSFLFFLLFIGTGTPPSIESSIFGARCKACRIYNVARLTILRASNTIGPATSGIYRRRINYAVAWSPLNSLSVLDDPYPRCRGLLIECSRASRGHRESPASSGLLRLEPLLPSHLHPHVLRKLTWLRSCYVYFTINYKQNFV